MSARCVLELTEMEVSILNHYCNYNIAKILREHVSGVYKEEEIQAVFEELKQATAKILTAAKESRQYIFDERYGGKGKKEIRP